MTGLRAALRTGIVRFRGPRRSAQLGRSVIALAQMSVLLLTPWSDLVPEIAGQARAPLCEGPSRASFFCLDPSPDDLGARVAMVIVLVAVVAGLAPRIVSLLHLWASFSLASSIGLPDGGEQVAQVASLLLVLVCLPDGRVLAWKRAGAPTGEPSVLDGVSAAGWWVLRLQMAFVYAESGLSKLSNEDWVNGSALYYVVRDPSFGASGLVGQVMRAVTDVAAGTALLTWGTIAVEVAIAVLLLLGPEHRRRALWCVVVLHVGIALVIGLWSFAAVMIGAVLVAAAPERGTVGQVTTSARGRSDDGSDGGEAADGARSEG